MHQAIEPRRVRAGRGARWLAEGFTLFRGQPFTWILYTAILYAAVALATYVTVLGVLLLLIYPGVVAGLTRGAASQAGGGELRLSHLWSGLRDNPVHLTTLGGVYLLGQVAIVSVMVALGGSEMQQIAAGRIDPADTEALAAALGAVMRSLLVGTALSVPLLMAMWFSPMLVLFSRLAPLPALGLSVRACWRNFGAFTVYGAIALAVLFLAMLPFGGLSPQANPGLWLVTPLLLPSVYASYRDVFGAAGMPAVAAGGGPPAPD